MTVRKIDEIPVYIKVYKYYIYVVYRECYSKILVELSLIDIGNVNKNLFGFDSNTQSANDEGDGR